MANKTLIEIMDDIIQDMNNKTDEQLFDEFSESSEEFRTLRNELENKITECELKDSIRKLNAELYDSVFPNMIDSDDKYIIGGKTCQMAA